MRKQITPLRGNYKLFARHTRGLRTFATGSSLTLQISEEQAPFSTFYCFEKHITGHGQEINLNNPVT